MWRYKYSPFNQELPMHCMTRICSPTYFQIASCMRLAILNTVMLHWDGFGLLTSTSKRRVSPMKSAILPRFSSSDGFWSYFMKYYRAFFKNHYVHNLLALWLNARTCWQWAGPKLDSLLSTHCLIGAYFLITKSDKRMRLLTRLYGIIHLSGYVD